MAAVYRPGLMPQKRTSRFCAMTSGRVLPYAAATSALVGFRGAAVPAASVGRLARRDSARRGTRRAGERDARSPLEVQRQAAQVLLRRPLRCERVDEVRGVLGARQLEADQQLEVDRQVQRLGHAHVDALGAVVLFPIFARLLDLTV